MNDKPDRLRAVGAPTRAKRKLGAFLYDMRKRTEFTAEDAAGELLMSRPTVSRYESGAVMAAWASVMMLLQLYGTTEDEVAEAKDLWVQAHDEPKPVRLPATTPKSFRKLIAAEADAERERIVAPNGVHGLLQTEQYARALMASGHRFRASETQTKDSLSVRLNRQKQLAGNDPLQLHVLLDQVAIVRKVGGSEVMRDQLTYLVEVSARPNVTLQVIPFDAGAYGTMNGAFVIVDYPGSSEPSTVYLEYPAGGAWLEDSDDVQKFVKTFGDVCEVALSPDDTVNLIRRQIGILE
jgi:transcriptional regulator with XRE-family HTH domain